MLVNLKASIDEWDFYLAINYNIRGLGSSTCSQVQVLCQVVSTSTGLKTQVQVV